MTHEEHALTSLKRAERLSLTSDPHAPTFQFAVAQAVVYALLAIGRAIFDAATAPRS